jgi:hypothetical protein
MVGTRTTTLIVDIATTVSEAVALASALFVQEGINWLCYPFTLSPSPLSPRLLPDFQALPSTAASCTVPAHTGVWISAIAGFLLETSASPTSDFLSQHKHSKTRTGLVR